ncbi:hypothetical protein [Catellatospora tritici]|uniref:hypothetical protein n=1 Tax=Catellatospora tritici TaxID=2851566 RepID=UPI001C2D8DC1|nr:hypothetical protein [Catellatospora tritici]MBV1853275.1 hypothetical protein [Catellatospora tritici]
MTIPEHVPSHNAINGGRERLLREPERPQLPGDTMLEPATSSIPSLSLEGFGDPSFPTPNWLDMSTESMVDHPLLRGLLMELPPRGSHPSPEWLSRWFDATRAVLDLVYNRR